MIRALTPEKGVYFLKFREKRWCLIDLKIVYHALQIFKDTVELTSIRSIL